jgi:dTDP-4-amino-4,6-dideoxygalactose transaminase
MSDIGREESAVLAAEGGAPVRTAQYPPWPVFDPEDVEAASEVLRSGKVNYWTGREGVEFEREFAEFVGTPHALALANGTVALELALYALGVGAGDEVVVPARTFFATASAVVARGAVPVVADVDRDSQNVTAETIAQALSPRTRAVIVVHLGGNTADMDPILRLARDRGLFVVEDCAQALGARYRGRAVGSLGDAAAFSFCQDKILTTAGEGGMLTTADDALFEAAWSYRDHGKDRTKTLDPSAGTGLDFRWLHDSFGTNWRMTEMQSAVGRTALGRVPAWVETRRWNAAQLDACFSEMDALRIVTPPDDCYWAYYKYYAFVRPDRLAPGWDRDRIGEAIRAEGIPVYSGSCPEIYREQAFRAAGLGLDESLPVAQELGETSLMFLVHPGVEPSDVGDVCDAMQKVMRRASG